MRGKINAVLIILVLAGICMMFAGFTGGAKTSFYVDRSGIHLDESNGGAKVGFFQPGRASSGDAIEIKNDDLPRFNSVEAELIDMDIILEVSPFYGIELRYDEMRDISWEIRNEKLTVVDNTTKKGVSFAFGFFFGQSQKTYLIVRAPKDALNEITAKTVSGKIEISGFVSQKIYATTVSGNISAKSTEAGSLKTASVSGRISASDISAREFECETASGRIELSGFFAERATTKSVSGKISANIDAAPGEYLVKLSTVTGSARIDGRKITFAERSETATIGEGGNAKYSWSSTTVSGGIDLTFR